MNPGDVAVGSEGGLSALGRTIAVGLAYYLLAKLGLMLAVAHPSASPVWPASGLALAAVLLWGRSAYPAILLGAFVANVTASGYVGPSLLIGAGNTLQAAVGGYLLSRWSSGGGTFDTPIGVAKFALVSSLAAIVSATLGVLAIWLSGKAATAGVPNVWITWWLGDLAGVLVVAPAIVLWVRSISTRSLPELQSLALYAATCVVGLLAFSPILAQTPSRDLLAFLAPVPLLWAALKRGRRDTATVGLILAAFAVWGTMEQAGPFARADLNEALLLTLAFVLSAALPSLALSAEVAVRKRAERGLRERHGDLDVEVGKRTAELAEANIALQKEIDKRASLEASLEQQRIQLFEAQRMANLGSWSWDVGTGMVAWSPQLYEIYGVAPNEFKGTLEEFLSRIHPDDRVAISTEIGEALRTGGAFRREERIVRPDGEVRHLRTCGETVKDRDGHVVQMLGVCQDITVQREADTALRESESTLRSLINGVHDYAIYLLDPNGNIVSWNAGAARIKQYSEKEIIGQHFSRFYTPEDFAAGVPARALKTAASEGKYEGEGWRVRKDGTRFWANVLIDAIRDAEGKLVGFGKVTRDVTEKREAQLALDQARDQLMQAQKMETIGQVTGGVAHDFNNLLAAILASLQLLEKRLPQEGQSKQLLDNALRAAERGASLTQRLLAFARRQDLRPESVDVPKLIAGMTDLLRRALGPAVEIKTDFTSAACDACIDPAQLELAIFNLSVNARDAMPAGGQLTIAAAPETTQGEPDIDLAPGSYVRITVTDTGAGMDEKTLQRAVEPFFTTKGVGKGTGLGLSMVQGLAAQSGGAMRIASEPGQGTSVTMWLPTATQAVAEVAAPVPEAKAAPVVCGCRVLVVDDDPLVSMGTVAMLEDLGHSTLEASSGKQALSILETTPEIDIVVTDQAMPGMTGTELAKRIRELRPELPIILATGYADLPGNPNPEMPRLSKPYRQEDLAAVINRLVDRA